MSYASLIASAFGKRPIWLYEFTQTVAGSTTTTRLASGWSDYLDGSSVTWTASPITHTRFRITAAGNRAETEIVFPQSDTFARSFLTDFSYGENTVKIYHEFMDQSPVARVIKFSGRVVGTRPRFTRLTLICENQFTQSRRKALPDVMQRVCRHTLYHGVSSEGFIGDHRYGCGVNIATFRDSGTLTNLTGNVADIPAASSKADGYYSGGVFEWNNRAQLITKHQGYEITLLGPVEGMADALTAAGSSGLSVTIAPGCDKTRTTCNTRFNNLAKFGGFPWMDETPFDGKTLF